MLFYFLFLSLSAWSQVSELPDDFVIDEKFKKANQIDFKSLYSEKSRLKSWKPNTEAEIRESKLSDVKKKSGKKWPARIEIVMDSSGSMGQKIDTFQTRMYAAKRVVARYIIDQWKKRNHIALRVYGSRRRNDCTDNFLSIPFGPSRLDEIEKAISFMLPIGRTPLYQSVLQAKKDLKDYPGPKGIVVFTDGKETCGGDLCQFAKEIKRDKSVDIKIFTVGVGFDLKEKKYDGIECLRGLGPSFSALQPEDLYKAFEEVSDKLNTENNLKVITPNPDHQVNLYRWKNGKRKLVQRFSSAWSIYVPPGEYEAVVLSEPNYVFPKFKIPPGKKVVLEMKGHGQLRVNFPKDLLDVELLDENGVVMQKFTSGYIENVPMGVYKVKVSRVPYFEEYLEDIEMVPGAKMSLDPGQASAITFRHSTAQGFYIYDSDRNLIGNYLTNAPLVLPKGNYQFFLNKSCHIKNVKPAQGPRLKYTDCSQKNKKLKKL